MTGAGGQRNVVNWLALGLLAAVTVTAAWMLARQDRAPALEHSALGFDGLAVWLALDGMDTRRFLGRGPLSGDGVGLRILPLYDTDLDTVSGRNFEPEGAYLTDTQRNMFRHVVTMKADTLPTLVVLPKWRDGVRLVGVTHPEFLIARERGAADPVASEVDAADADTADAGADAAEADTAASDPSPDEASQTRFGRPDTDEDRHSQPVTYVEPELLAIGDTGWETLDVSGFADGMARLYAPQWMTLPEGCEALIGVPERALLGRCEFDDLSYWVLSDPDLLNNHGLTQAGNADLARQLVRRLADGGDVLVDYSTAVFLTATPDEHQRSWADMARMFEPPFTWLWLAGGGLLVLLLWRAGLRGRPLIAVFEHGHGAARQVALRAQARLMRNAQADGALIRTLVANRRQALAEAWLGRERRTGHAFQRTVALLRLKDRELAARLTDIFDRADALPDRIRQDVAIDALADVEHVYQQALELA
ncbi:hypothetical protein [Maricaulis maris]|uniref:DUF4350 domain-containing protein n=1 Tax=Maricaulis maris TaxID=74318 RepID=A0A495D3A5_9PROT|nr:hypothetical protein [Maricaulis maris]RKQ96233.1 hypothetical protein C7435_2485 [Maricaulis maris]